MKDKTYWTGRRKVKVYHLKTYTNFFGVKEVSVQQNQGTKQ
jgi:hypothetical protein